jgi:hypothetical protein
MRTPLPLLLLLWRPAFAQTLPLGVERVESSWEFHPEAAAQAGSREEGAKIVRDAALWLAAMCPLSTPELAGHTADSIAAYLAEELATDATARRVYCDKGWLRVTARAKDGTYIEAIGMAGAPPSRGGANRAAPRTWHERRGSSAPPAEAPGGLWVWRRWLLKSLDNHKQPFLFSRYYDGATATETVSSELSDEPLVVRSNYFVKRTETRPDGTKVEKTIPGGSVVQYRIPDEEGGPSTQDWKPKCEEITLAYRYSDPPTRNQGQRGTCYLFATAGLLEAALQKAYAVDIALSEQDLAQAIIDESRDPEHGGYVPVTLELAMGRGVATRASVPYPEERRPAPSKTEAAIRGKITAVDLSGEPAAATAAPAAARRARPLEAERALLKKAFSRMSLKIATSEAWDMQAAESKAERVKRFIVDRLCGQGMPVAFSFGTDNLKGWDGTGEPDLEAQKKLGLSKYHAVLIYGFRKDPATGKLVFLVRNSWGFNPEIREDDLWRTTRVVALELGYPLRPAPPGLAELAR